MSRLFVSDGKMRVRPASTGSARRELSDVGGVVNEDIYRCFVRAQVFREMFQRSTVSQIRDMPLEIPARILRLSGGCAQALL